MNIASFSNSSLELGWRQLSHGRSRMVVALVGVGISVVLILVVLSLREAVISSAMLLPSSLKGDVLVLSPRTQSIMRTAQFPRRFLERLRGVSGVESVSPVSIETAQWVNPETRQEHPIRVYGMELEQDVLGLPGINPSDPALRKSDTALFDQLAREKFGPVTSELRAGREFSTEVNNRRISVTGLTQAGISVGVDGNLFVTQSNFQRLFPGQNPAACHIGIVKLRSGSDAEAVAQSCRSLLGSEALVLTREQAIAAEREYMRVNDPVDFIMGMIAGVAFLVGMIIVYQILYTDVLNHLSQFATLKAIGFTDGYLLRIILSEGLILSILGFWPGLGVAHLLTLFARSAIIIPIGVTGERAVFVFALTVVMCVAAAAIAVRKLSSADPADVF